MMDKFKNLFKAKEHIEIDQPDEKKSIEHILTELDYPIETHFVETEDGYILQLFRIGRKGEIKSGSTSEKKKHPVLFQHGLLDSSDGWLCNEEHLNLPLILANLGFDIWLSNSRGNKYSRNHRKLNPDEDYEFWAFSFEDMGYYDVPACIKYVLKINSNFSKIHYIGHSQGTCMMFAALSNPNLQTFFQDTVETFIALAPVARVGNIKSKLISFAETVKPDILFSEEIFPANEGRAKEFGIWVNKVFPKMSNYFLDLISDDNSYHVNNQKRMPVFLSHYPSGTSFKAIQHFSQNMKSRKFKRYDYGKEANSFIYRSKEAPEYNLKSIKGFKIALICGEEDKLSSTKDVEWLASELGDNIVYYKKYDKMGHISFLCGLNVEWFIDLIDFVYSIGNYSS